jgi:hypothetical protein
VPFELSLIDLVSPYVLQGDTLGQWHAILDVLRVAEHEIASDENGITIRGTIDFEGNLSLDPTSMALAFANTENHPETGASRRDQWNRWNQMETNWPEQIRSQKARGGR